MDRRNEKVMLLATGTVVVCLIIDVILARTTHLAVFAGVIPHLIITAFISILILAREWLARLTRQEEQDRTLEREEKKEAALFRGEPEDEEPFSVRYSRHQFERFIIPLTVPLLAILQGYLGWLAYQRVDQLAEEPTGHLLAASFLVGQALATFLLSRYSLGLATVSEGRLLRGPGILLGLSALVSLLGVVAAVVSKLAYGPADRITTMILAGLLGLLAIESVMNTIGEIYRPGKKKGEMNVAYESRLSAIVADPSAWARNVAQTLDYQFGFKVSETWFYRFLESALFPLIIIQCLILYFLSCLVFISPSEEGVLERFGRPVQKERPLASGFHLKWPWPFETVRRYPAKLVQTITVGFEEEEEEEHHEHSESRVVVWSKRHQHAERNFLVASRGNTATHTSGNNATTVSLLNMALQVHYRISDVPAYAYNYAEPQRLLQQAAHRVVSLKAVSADMFDLMGPGQQAASVEIERAIQKAADDLNMGVEIVKVEVVGIHPPVAVIDSFESVGRALEEKKTSILKARTYAAKALPQARVEAGTKVVAAEAYKIRRKESASAEAEQFIKRLASYKKSPKVYRSRQWLETLERALGNTRKYVIPHTIPTKVIQLKPEDRIGPKFFEDLNPNEDKKKE